MLLRVTLIAVVWAATMGQSVALASASPALISADTLAPERLQTLATGLEHPWALAFLPEGGFLVTERPGRMRRIDAQGRLSPPIGGLPELVARGQGGLLDLVIDVGFERNRTLYFCFSQPAEGGANSTALARARLPVGASRLEEVRVVFSQLPRVASSLHFGCRIVQAADGSLFLMLGERFQRMQEAQTLDNHLGKIVRVTRDGAPAAGNPLIGRAGARPEIWSYGHRNPQGATLGPDGRLWMHEHGPQGGDEINLPEPGLNYGWPVVTFGEQYGGGPIGEGLTAKPGMEPPVYHWTPSIAPSGMAFLTSDRYGASWRGNLFIGSLKFNQLVRLVLSDRRVIREHRLEGLGERLRDVRQGPDGLLYLLTDSPKGRLLRLLPP